ncbi:MAG: hypothetical protein ABR955_14835, partial [Verrucomicrobiota bacterium]
SSIIAVLSIVIISIGVCIFSLGLFRYKHVVVDESSKLKVTERSTESNDSQGKPLFGRMIGLPTKSILTGNGYVVTVSTPVNSIPVVFLKAYDKQRKVLDLRGAHFRVLETSAMGLEGYRYSFIVDEANGAPMEFDVVSEQGVVLGHEKIRYHVVSRGYTWTIELP